MNKQKNEAKENANMADNEVVFRKLNNQLRKLIDELNSIALRRGEMVHAFKTDEVYQFYCECSDENCLARMSLRFDTYEKAHERDDTFTMFRDHEVLDIEKVISITKEYCVVQKFETPKQTSETFHETALDNVN
jgi:hypothetical protein